MDSPRTPPRSNRSILVLFDGVEVTTSALRNAVDLADSGAVIELVGIVNPRWVLYGVAAAYGSRLQPEQIHREELALLNKALLEVTEALPDAVGIRIITKVGRPRRVIAELRRSGSYDLMMLPDWARRRRGRRQRRPSAPERP